MPQNTSTGPARQWPRYYNPSIGRFLTQDTWRGSRWAPWTQNLYAYVGNNPVNYIDPTGHWWQLAGALIGAAISTAVYMITTPEDDWTAGGFAGAVVTGGRSGLAASMGGGPLLLGAGAIAGALGSKVADYVDELVYGTPIPEDSDEKAWIAAAANGIGTYMGGSFNTGAAEKAFGNPYIKVSAAQAAAAATATMDSIAQGAVAAGQGALLQNTATQALLGHDDRTYTHPSTIPTTIGPAPPTETIGPASPAPSAPPASSCRCHPI